MLSLRNIFFSLIILSSLGTSHAFGQPAGMSDPALGTFPTEEEEKRIEQSFDSTEEEYNQQRMEDSQFSLPRNDVPYDEWDEFHEDRSFGDEGQFYDQE